MYYDINSAFLQLEHLPMLILMVLSGWVSGIVHQGGCLGKGIAWPRSVSAGEGEGTRKLGAREGRQGQQTLEVSVPQEKLCLRVQLGQTLPGAGVGCYRGVHGPG